MDKKSLKEYLKNIPEDKPVTRRILANMTCEEFRDILKQYPDFSEIYRNKQLYFRLSLHIKSVVFPEDNCRECLILFTDYLKGQNNKREMYILDEKNYVYDEKGGEK